MFLKLHELKIKKVEGKGSDKRNPFVENITQSERLSRFQNLFQELKLEDFVRKYEGRKEIREKEASHEDIVKVFDEMGKKTEESKHINCGACGYVSCKEMATAILLGYNHKRNCIHYVKESLAEEKIRITSQFRT